MCGLLRDRLCSYHSCYKKSHTCFLLLRLSLWCVVYEQCVKGQTIWENDVSDIATTYAKCFQIYRFLVSNGHLDCSQMCIHADIDTCTAEKKNIKHHNSMLKKLYKCNPLSINTLNSTHINILIELNWYMGNLQGFKYWQIQTQLCSCAHESFL